MITPLNKRFAIPSLQLAFKTSRIIVLFAILLGVANTNLVAQELISAAADAPRYRLSKPRFESSRFGQRIFVVDYTRTKTGDLDPTPAIQAGGTTKSGELIVRGAAIAAAGGELKISTGIRSPNDIELYFFIQGPYGKMLISNIARVGNPGKATRARKWTTEEKKAYERAKLSKTPPKNLPDGYIAVTPEAKLLPGMPIKAGSYAEWVDATVIRAEAKSQVLIKMESSPSLTTLNRSKWLAIKSETLKQGTDNPNQFSTDIRVLPDSKLIVPDDATPLPDDLVIPRGTPLLFDYKFKWHDVYVLKAETEKIKLRYKGYGSSWDETKPRSMFLINDEILKQLKDPNAVKKFASNIETESFPTSNSKGTGGRKRRVHSYPIKLELPKDSQTVPDDLSLAPGTPLAACWARKWNAVSVLSENDDGTVNIRFDFYKTEYTMKRDELVIQNKTIEELKSKKSETAEQQTERYTASELAETLRVWTDITGKFKIEAYYLSHTETKVTLKTAADREINMPLKKLSTSDQELLSEIVNESDNPFN